MIGQTMYAAILSTLLLFCSVSCQENIINWKATHTNTSDIPCEVGDCVHYYDDQPAYKPGESFATGCYIPLGCNVDITISIQLKNNRPLDTWEVTFGCFGIIYVDTLKLGYNSVFYYSNRKIPPAKKIEQSACAVKIKNTNFFYSQEYIGNYVIKSYEDIIEVNSTATIIRQPKNINNLLIIYGFICISIIVVVLLIILFYNRIKYCITFSTIK